MSKELIDADKGMSLSKGSYFGVIIDVEEEYIIVILFPFWMVKVYLN